MDDVICGICGTIGQLYLGDGNKKNCCSLKGVQYAFHIVCHFKFEQVLKTHLLYKVLVWCFIETLTTDETDNL